MKVGSGWRGGRVERRLHSPGRHGQPSVLVRAPFMHFGHCVSGSQLPTEQSPFSNGGTNSLRSTRRGRLLVPTRYPILVPLLQNSSSFDVSLSDSNLAPDRPSVTVFTKAKSPGKYAGPHGSWMVVMPPSKCLVCAFRLCFSVRTGVPSHVHSGFEHGVTHRTGRGSTSGQKLVRRVTTRAASMLQKGYPGR